MSFERRIREAKLFEDAVLAAVRQSVWDAEPFGQGQLTQGMHDHLRRYRTDDGGATPLRWLPDLIAARRMPHGKTAVRLIDAKAGERWKKTGNHDVEKAALDAAELWEQSFGVPVYFVFTDWSFATVGMLRDMELRDGPCYGNGSDTPYWLFAASSCTPFDALFPRPLQQEA